jgi:hypothetical protein
VSDVTIDALAAEAFDLDVAISEELDLQILARYDERDHHGVGSGDLHVIAHTVTVEPCAELKELLHCRANDGASQHLTLPE